MGEFSDSGGGHLCIPLARGIEAGRSTIAMKTAGEVVAHALLRAVPALSRNLAGVNENGRSVGGARKVHKPPRKSLETALSEVAHAFLRAASTLASTPLDAGKPGCRHECRHGTQECVRHQHGSGSDYRLGEVCGQC